MFTYPSASGIQFTSNFYAEKEAFYPYLYMAPAWSLPVELCFYAVAPFICGRPRLLLRIVIAAFAVRMITYIVYDAADPWAYRFFPSELLFFAVGALAYDLGKSSVWRPSVKEGRGFFYVLSASLILFNVFSPFYGIFPFSIDHLALIALFTVCTTIVFFSGFHISFDETAGDLSFPIYLIHWPILRVLETFEMKGPILGLVLAVACSFLRLPLSRKFDTAVRKMFPSAKKIT